jgi:hypothetical protein
MLSPRQPHLCQLDISYDINDMLFIKLADTVLLIKFIELNQNQSWYYLV